jgi:hypothetical protein
MFYCIVLVVREALLIFLKLMYEFIKRLALKVKIQVLFFGGYLYPLSRCRVLLAYSP